MQRYATPFLNFLGFIVVAGCGFSLARKSCKYFTGGMESHFILHVLYNEFI